MKDEFKFMTGNAFKFKEGAGIMTPPNLLYICNETFIAGETKKIIFDLSFDNIKQLILTGITADCLNILASNDLKDIRYVHTKKGGHPTNVNITGQDSHCVKYKKKNEELKQFYLRVAKEMGWVE